MITRAVSCIVFVSLLEKREFEGQKSHQIWASNTTTFVITLPLNKVLSKVYQCEEVVRSYVVATEALMF